MHQHFLDLEVLFSHIARHLACIAFCKLKVGIFQDLCYSSIELVTGSFTSETNYLFEFSTHMVYFVHSHVCVKCHETAENFWGQGACLSACLIRAEVIKGVV